ncbi:nifU-like protein 2, chloroplastic [Camellia sinensis]|uniref:nifU-like protein 2, chloroplastic n=1 Tax=Camellia sinensis TaxID=4442 RepID=UPI001036D611|nr:nifU-like protein 2, chloroplastic [Camellia sinensis]
MQTAVLNPSYSVCRAQQTLEPSCSLSSPSTTPFFHPSSPFKNSIFGPRIFLSERSNLVQRSFARSVPTGIHRRVVKTVATPDSAVELSLTAENVESVLDDIRPYLLADGGNVALHEIDGNVVRLKLQGACGSCPGSVMTRKMS